RYRLAREEWEASSDAEGVLDYGGQQALILRSMVEGGDSVLRMLPVTLADAGTTVPLRLQGLEGDQIDTMRDHVLDQSVRLGVKYGEWGRREGVYLHKVHPGELTVGNVEAS